MNTDIKKLSDQAHILKYPEAYVGSIHPVQHPAIGYADGAVVRLSGYSPGVVRLFKEIVDNSVDAAVRSGFRSGTHIHCDITSDGFSVSDDGHGIPIKRAADGTWMPELALGSARAGSNFDVDKRSTVGLYGVGSFVVNVLSSRLYLDTRHGKDRYTQTFSDNASRHTDPEIQAHTGPTGTSVTVTLDAHIVKWDPASVACALQLLNNTMFVYPGVELTARVNGAGVPLLAPGKFTEALGLETEWCRVELDGLKVIFGLIDRSSDMIGLVNGTQCSGLHLSTLRSQVSSALCDKLEKIVSGCTRGDISRTLSGIASFRIYDPGFGSLTKTDLVSCDTTALKSAIGDALPYIESGLLSSTDFIDALTLTVERRTGKKLKSKERTASTKLKSTKLVDVYRTSGDKADKTYLLITEGDSAKGLFVQARDPKKHAVYPLRGKILNAVSAHGGVERVASNAVLFELSTILGLSLTNEDIENCRYDYIVSLTDADVDGDNISGLIYGYLRQYWPSLFDAGRVLRLCTPSHIVVDGNKRTPYYGGELPKTIKGSLTYIKGLGSLTLHDVKAVFADPRFEQMDPDDGADKLMRVILGEPSLEKREWLG